MGYKAAVPVAPAMPPAKATLASRFQEEGGSVVVVVVVVVGGGGGAADVADSVAAVGNCWAAVSDMGDRAAGPKVSLRNLRCTCSLGVL